MRRKDRYIANGSLIGAGVTMLTDVIIQWLEHRNNGENFTWESYSGERTLKSGLVGAGVGASVGWYYYQYVTNQESNVPFNPDSYLNRILISERIKSDPIFFEKVLKIKTRVREFIHKEFASILTKPPTFTGSFRKGTAIGSKYDLDLVLPFKNNAFSTLENMYEVVFNVIGREFNGTAKVIRQRKSIGLTFQVDEEDLHFDIVPGREINDYNKDQILNLYVRPDLRWRKGSFSKVNVGFDIGLTVNKPEVRKVIKLLKVYRDRNQLSLPTIIIEQCVVTAMSSKNFGVHQSPKVNLLNCMSFISERLEKEWIIDLSNSNNDLSKRMSDSYKKRIADLLIKDVITIKNNNRYLREIYEL